jgi:hypothetical protein
MALISCSHCGAQIADVAPTCPHCGGPNAGAPKPKRKTSALTWIVAVVFGLPCLGGIVISAIKAPENQARAAAASDARHAEWQSLQTEPAQKSKDREALIQKLINMDVFHEVQYRSTGATVQVGPAFYAASLDEKKKFVGVVASAAWKRSERADIITLVDFRNGKEVGTYSIDRGLDLH